MTATPCYPSYSTSRPDKLLLPEPLLKVIQPLFLLEHLEILEPSRGSKPFPPEEITSRTYLARRGNGTGCSSLHRPSLSPAVLRAAEDQQSSPEGVAADTVKELMCPEAQLLPVYPLPRCVPAGAGSAPAAAAGGKP